MKPITRSEIQILIISLRYLNEKGQRGEIVTRKDPIMRKAIAVAYSLDVETATEGKTDKEGISLEGFLFPD
jgi:hypothetical protein